MSDWNDFFSSGIINARARTYWIYKAIQAYDFANRATLSPGILSLVEVGVSGESSPSASLRSQLAEGVAPLLSQDDIPGLIKVTKQNSLVLVWCTMPYQSSNRTEKAYYEHLYQCNHIKIISFPGRS